MKARSARRHLLLALWLTFSAGAVQASGADRRPSPPLLPAYRQECSACHLAYPPGMLPKTSWQRLMADLPHHFGTDASLDATTVVALAGWLQAHAGTWRVGADTTPPEDRITRSTWFVRKHDEVPSSKWTHPKVRSAANCVACHLGAERGDFNEDDVQIPR